MLPEDSVPGVWTADPKLESRGGGGYRLTCMVQETATSIICRFQEEIGSERRDIAIGLASKKGSPKINDAINLMIKVRLRLV